MKKNFIFKRVLTLVLAVMMLVTAMPVNLLAQDDSIKPADYNNIDNDKAKIVNNKVPVKPAKPEAGKTATDLIKNPDQPAIYTLRTDYKVQRGEKYQVDYQPYIASVGEAAIQAEKDKVNKTMDLPDIAGYDKPQDNFTIDYKTVKDAADGKNATGDKDNGFRYSANKEFNYAAISNKIKIKHVFQKLDDFTKYTNPNGSVGDEGALITTQNGNTGSTMQASPLTESDPRREGFIPEADYINMQVPENAENFILEYRYNRVHYDVVFDSAGGTPLPTRTLYYGQEMPKIADADIPTKVGGDFLGWKPSVELKTKDGKTYKANEIIAVGTGQAIKNLDANLIMPASEVTFTAVWKDKEKAGYAVQFWAEKADHADGASLADKYDYIGTRVYKDQDTGMRPNLDNEPVKDIVFPDLDQARLAKIWANARFNRGHDLYLNKFYVYNQALTHEENKDPENVNLVKSVDSTGKTVYNIYYDRQVYELYFTKSNAQPAANTFYPEIWGYDEAKGEVVKKGGPGNPYHYKARFNQLMLGWPNDAMQTKGFSKGMQSFGWGPNYTKANWPGYLDTPPYRLNADEFLDMKNYDTWGGYKKPIDKGDGTFIDVNPLDFTTLSFGINQAEGSMPHHMDFWMDGFKPGETIIRYDLYRFKADTNSESYAPKYPKVQGFTGKRDKEPAEFLDEGGIDDKNDERAEVTKFPAKTYTVLGEDLPLGKMKFIKAFFSNVDEFGDPDGVDAFEKNGYLKFEYTRNKYPLRFNYDPSKIKGDNEFNATNQLQTFYEFPLKALSPDADTEDSYKTGNPKNILDNPEKLQALGLTDLVFNDPNDNGKLKVKRPDNLSDQMVFKGWALDPAGNKLIWENAGEKMPNHPVNLYAKWGEPDYKWKVTFDPNGGSLRNIKEENLTTSRKKIQEGDIGQEEVKTFAHKEANDGDKQVFTVIQRQKLVEPAKPTKKGYDFMGWEIIHYKKNQKGDYTDEIDNSYRETYKVPELYSFGNDVVAPVYLKAIWVPNDRVDVDVIHHIMSLDLSKEIKTIPETLHNKRTGYLVAASGDKQDEKYILANHKELEEKLPDDLKALYKEYNDRVKANNTYFQTFKVEPEKIPDPNDSSKMIENPNNVFHFFYRPFRTRDYKVNYIDERYKAKVEDFFKGLKLTDINKLMAGEEYKNADDKGKEAILLAANEGNKEKFEAKRTDFENLIKKYQIIDPEAVSNGNRHYDARNYRQIPGWVLAKDEKPQQQLVFDVNEGTNEFLGINGTGADQVFFYYKDVRVIEVPGDKEPPKGYVRVTFKADKGGSFGKDAEGKDITELHYDVIKGLQSQLLPVPKELEEGKEKEEGKYYITPETGKKFIKWDKSPLLNDNTIIKEAHTFTAFFEWSGLSASGLVRTEAFKDSNGKLINDFAPKIEDLKKQLVWMEKGVKKDLPAGAVIKLFDEAGTELTTDDQVYELVNEKNKADKDELVRTVNVKAKVTFTDGKDPQELTIPITVYKNVYEALNKEGDKPLFLKEAEGKDAKDGGLKDILKDNDGNRYIKVTIKPNKDFTNKDDKVYYVNPNAWVEISNDSNGTAALINWTADQDAQNENKAANGKFDFTKRHKFTKDTVISPRLSQTSGLEVHESYKDSKNNWVNDFIDKELTDANLKAAIQVKNGSAVALGTDDKVTIVDDAGEPYADDAALKAALYDKLQEKDDNGKVSRIENIKVKVTFANGEVQTLTVPVKVIKNIYQAKTEAGKPDYVPKNYVKVTLDPTTKAKDPQKYFYYVNPDAKVLIPGKDPVGVKEDFTGWTMKKDSATGDGASYKLSERHQFAEDSTIIAQYGQGKAKIKYVDDSGKEIDPKYHIVGVDYPTEKIGKLGDSVPDPAYNQEAEKAAAPKFKGYIITNVSVDKKPANYTDPATATITYQYNKKITTDDKSESNVYFPVIFDANTGEFEPAPKDKKTVYVYFDGENASVEKVTFKEVREEVEEKYGKPSKANEDFIEWQDKAKSGSAVADNYEIQFKGWDWTADPDNGYVPETIYAAYGKASALVKYLDLNGKPIAGEFKIDGVEYPTEKAGTADEAIPSDVFTKDTAPKFTGYKFNRIELNPKDGKYALKDKATIKIYYEKDLDVIPAENGTEKPDGYVEVKFVPTDKAKDATEKIFYVNPKKDVTIPIADPVAKATFTFKEWKIGDVTTGEAYNPGTPKKFTDATTVITATYTSSEDIIPYDPSETDPMTRPEGYVRVSFAAEEGLKLTNVKHYYVKKNAGITLDNTDLAKPGVTAEIGYKFDDKWDKEDSFVITDQDVVVKAKSTSIPDYVEKTNENPDKPDDKYVTVTFVAGANGVIKDNGNKIDKKVYYVNPNKYVNLPAPTPVADTGYEFGAWSTAEDNNYSLANFIKYSDDTTITANFNLVNTVIPIVDGKTKRPKNFVKVTFQFNDQSKEHGNLIGTTEYYVDSTQKVTLTPPTVEANIGYKFDGWSQDANTATKYESDTTIECTLEKLDDIIKAQENDTDDDIPHGYVLVYFYAGNQGTAKGQAMYYVNPEAGKTIGDLGEPSVTANTGYVFKGWDADTADKITKDRIIYAKYDDLADKILVGPGVKQPDGYVKVTFVAGANGTIDERAYYVNPNKYVKLDPPETHPNNEYEFSLWDPDVRNFTRYEKDTTITAKFIKKKLVTSKQDGKPQPPGTIEVNFIIKSEDSRKGSLDGVKTYYVVPNTDVIINPPKVITEPGFEFDKWTVDTTKPAKYTVNTTVEAVFKGFDPILPSTDDKGATIARPNGYVVVHFLNGEHGRLSGETIYYVNPKAGKKLEDILPKPSVIEDTGYVFEKWDKDASTAIMGPKDLEVTAQYTERPDIITAGPDQTAPRGYVVIIFKTDGNGTMTSRIKDEYGANAKNVHEIVYFVNPNKKIKLTKGDAGSNLLQVPATNPNANYIFDEWFNDIDEENPIIRGRVHVAKFKPAKVKLTYEANGATEGTPPAELEVNYNTSVRLAGQGNLKKTDASFKGWKIGDKIYQAGDQINLKENTTAYAQWDDDKKIIEYNPVDNPTTRPYGYLRVTFATDDGLSLKENKAYYVKKGTKLSDIKNGNKYGYPSVSPKTGYKFDKWDEGNTIEINSDITVTAKPTKLGTVIPATGAPNEKPNGYKEVTFVVKAEDAAKGSITGVAKFYVNPTEYVTITSPPTAKAETGFEFGGWNPNPSIPKVYDEDTTIIASFNGLKDIVPKTADDESEKPKGYVTVKFDIDGEGGSIVEGETKTYYADPSKKITLKAPKTLAKTGYEFEKWVIKPNGTEQEINLDDENTYKKNTTIYGKFKELKDIIPEEENGKTNAKPDGYVKVTFISETNGKLRDGDKKVYYVNPNSRTLGALTKPELIPDIGFEEDSWNILGVGAYDGRMSISGDMIINAKYKALDPAVPKDKSTGGENEKPKGYITVKFSTEINGKIKGTDKTEKIVYVNPNKAVALNDFDPEVTPNTGFDFVDWDTQIDKKIQYSGGEVIKALYNTKGDVIPQEKTDGTDKPAGYVTVTFDKGTNGKYLTGKTVYYVKPETAVAVTVPAPNVTAQTGYKFKTWDQELTQTFKVDTKITAQYEAIDDVVPQENPDGSDKPDGYITITFVKGDHGELSGKTVYYVKPKIAVTLTAPKVTADLGYKFTNWDPALQNIFTSDTIITAKYEAIDDVVPQKNPDGSDKPAGYVSVKFIPTDKATETKEKVYYVNPSKEVEITVTPVGTKVKDANGVSYDYTFTGWTVTRGTINSWSVPRVSGKFIQDTEITAKYSVTRGNIMPLPLAKDNAVTAIKDTPKAEDLIKNLYDANNPDNKNNLPSGTTFKYTDDGTPDVSGPGKATAKVEVKYPNGRTSIVTVPLTVVDHVVPQIGNDKPLVPDDYVEVIVDTTDKATENTYYVKTFWVKPEEMVTIPALKPTGKEITEDGVRKTNKFTHWLSDNDNKKYTGTIKDIYTIRDIFSKTIPKTTITAQYEFNKNVDPEGNNGMYLPLNSTIPSAKDFIKNVYNDSDPNNKGNLPPGTRFEFKDGVPDTSKEGKDMLTTIKVTYPNGEVKYENVKYNVSGDVVEQKPDEAKPDYVPNYYIQVIVTTKETVKKASEPVDPGTEPNPADPIVPVDPSPVTEKVERATEETKFTRTFWVKPDVKVTLPVKGSTIEGLIDEEDHRQWIFDHWQETGFDTRYDSDDIKGIFNERAANTPIYIEAKYRKADVPVPSADYVVTEVGVLPSEQQYRDVITAPKGKDIDKTEVLSRPDVSRPGLTKATIRVTYTDGTQAEVVVMVYVKERNDPRPSEPQIIYRDRIVEKEKIVEKIVKIKDNERLKELRYMQGYNGKFRPYDGLRRSEAAQILANALKADGYAYDPFYPISYTDIGDSWYTEAVRIVSQAGVFQGYNDGTFKPEGKITRAEWVATLRRFQDLKKVSGNDMGLSMGHWATEEIEAAYQAGWLGVYQDGIAHFDADKPITRQEVAYVSNKAFDRVLDKAYLKRNVNNMIHYKDINPSMPLYEDILCASNTLLTDGRYYKANAIDMDTLTFNIITDDLLIYQKKFQYISH